MARNEGDEEGDGKDAEWVVAYAPGSVGNLSCGFDVLGMALEGPGDRVVARRSRVPGVTLTTITGDDGALPRNPKANAATVAARALVAGAGREGVGVSLELHKGLPLAAGMGGSAASAAAAVRAVDALFGLRSSEAWLLEAALEGERAAAGARHPDNVAPSLLGGIVLARPGARRPVVPLPVPSGLSVAVVRQEVPVDTRSARRVLDTRIPLETAVEQWGNTAAAVAALHSGDWDLLGDALVDRVAEPRREGRIPGFQVLREAARGAGTVAFGISGAGPAVYALTRSRAEADAAGRAMAEALAEVHEHRAWVYVSEAPAAGARILKCGEAVGGAIKDDH